MINSRIKIIQILLTQFGTFSMIPKKVLFEMPQRNLGNANLKHRPIKL